MASRLAPTFGQWLLALFLQAMLYGMGMLQVYLYFFWYSKDGWGVRAAVVLIALFETFEIAAFFSASDAYLIDNFGNFANLAVYNWQTMAALAGVYMSTFVAQMYFACCIYRLHPTNKVIPCAIVALALGALGGGLGQLVRNIQVHGFPNLHETTVTRSLQAACAFACDVLITLALCWKLNKERTGIKSTNALLNYLVITAVNRGLLTTVCAALNIILFSAKPGTFYFIVWILLSGKMYMNSMMATLNTRDYARSISHPAGDHIALDTTRIRTTGIVVSVARTEEHDTDDKPGL